MTIAPVQVAALRAALAGDEEDFERLILRGEPMDGQFDDFMKGYAQFALLAELVRDLSEQELSMFLAEAREQGDAWLAQCSDR